MVLRTDDFCLGNFIKKLLDDKSYYEKRQAILNTGVLIVDEVLMLSLKVFDTLEYVCRRLYETKTLILVHCK